MGAGHGGGDRAEFDREQQFTHFESMGESHVRAIALAWDLPLQRLAFEWLRTKVTLVSEMVVEGVGVVTVSGA